MVLGREKKIRLLGVPLHSIPEDDFEPFILNLVRSPELKRAVVLDFKSFMRERRRLKKGGGILKDADLVLTTSKVIARTASRLYEADSVRIYPFSLAVNIMVVLERRGLSVYLLGGSSPDIMKVFSNVKASFPGLKIVGRYKGMFPPSEEDSVLTGIRKAGPSFLLAGSGIRKGDQWIQNSSDKLGGGLALWLPDAFEVMCGRKKPADEKLWLKRSGFSLTAFLFPWKWFRVFRYLHFWNLASMEKRRNKKGSF